MASQLSPTESASADHDITAAEPCPIAPCAAPLDIDNHLPFALGSLANRIMRSASRTYLSCCGVGINEWRILAHLAARPDMIASLICVQAGLDKAAVSRSVRQLQDNGLITISDDNAERGRALRLTEAGRHVYERLLTIAVEREQALLTGFTDAEKRQLLGFIARIQGNICGPCED